MDPDEKGGRKELRRVQREEIIIIIYYMRKNSVINKRKNKQTKNKRDKLSIPLVFPNQNLLFYNTTK